MTPDAGRSYELQLVVAVALAAVVVYMFVYKPTKSVVGIETVDMPC